MDVLLIQPVRKGGLREVLPGLLGMGIVVTAVGFKILQRGVNAVVDKVNHGEIK